MKKEELRILKTKASLYRALMILMKEKEFEQIKISEICAKSMINRSTFYDHFNDKYELLESFINDLKKELEENIKINIETKTIKEYYMETLKIMLNYIDDNIDIYSAATRINRNSIASDMMQEVVIESVTAKLNESFINKTKIPNKDIVLFYASGVIKILVKSLQDKNKFNKEEILETLSVLIPDVDYLVPNKK